MAGLELAPNEGARQQVVTTPCVVCGEAFTYSRRGSGRPRLFCGLACKTVRNQRRVTAASCTTCGESYRPRYRSAGYCSLECRQYPERRKWPTILDGKRARHDRRRARLASVECEGFTRGEIYKRDGWICGICHKPVDPEKRLPDPMSASLDHVVPVAKGGNHTRANVQLAHWLCNSRKGARVSGE